MSKPHHTNPRFKCTICQRSLSVNTSKRRCPLNLETFADVQKMIAVELPGILIEGGIPPNEI